MLLFYILNALYRPMRNQAIRDLNNQVKGQNGEKIVNINLEEALKGDTDFKIINNIMLKDDANQTHQIDHVVVMQKGIFCIETKTLNGIIYGNLPGTRWIQRTYGHQYFFENPIKQNENHIFYLNKVLQNKYKINNLIVFVNDNANNIKIDYVINLKDIDKYFENFQTDVSLSTNEINEIYNKIKENSVNVSNFEHTKSLKKSLKVYGKCPICGHALVKKHGKYGDFIGCINYPNCTYISKDINNE